ncbi:MAG: hypothetical protein GEV10_22220 [Streptosporangiales bacterium]|nr:hypothetical protein [Streptosporangiales bacterium]
MSPPALIVAITALVMSVAHGVLIARQGDPPVTWFTTGMIAATVLAAYAVVRAAPLRLVALTGSGVVLVAFGVLGILSIGLPILLAGLLALGAAAWSRVRAAH